MGKKFVICENQIGKTRKENTILKIISDFTRRLNKNLYKIHILLL